MTIHSTTGKIVREQKMNPTLHIGHKSVYTTYQTELKQGYSDFSLGKQNKYRILRDAHLLKYALAGGEDSNNLDIQNKKTKILNHFIERIQRDLNDGVLNKDGLIKDLKFQLDSSATNPGEKSKLAKSRSDISVGYASLDDCNIDCDITTERLNHPKIRGNYRHAPEDEKITKFVELAMQLAKHNTESDTKFNWFGIINKTHHIGLLLDDLKCREYLSMNTAGTTLN